jgi:hypothetical protein
VVLLPGRPKCRNVTTLSAPRVGPMCMWAGQVNCRHAHNSVAEHYSCLTYIDPLHSPTRCVVMRVTNER